MRVAFNLIGGSWWTGGARYLTNLLSALAELPGRPIEPILFTTPGAEPQTVAPLLPYLAAPPVEPAAWSAGRSRQPLGRLAASLVFQRDRVAERVFRDADIDLVFQHAAWYGYRFGLPTLAWIADFQHRYLPDMFSRANYWRRELGYHGLAACATTIMVASEHARRDCERFYPFARNKTLALPFATVVDPEVWAHDPEAVRQRYGLPERFLLLPNQFWKHKNHLVVVEALRQLKAQGHPAVIAVSGTLQDFRHPAYPQQVVAQAERAGLTEQFRVLGQIPIR